MNKLLHWAILAILCIALFSPLHFVQAQESTTLEAQGGVTLPDGKTMSLTMTFHPGGGEVTGNFLLESEWSPGDGTTCTITNQINLTGTFDGGDGGAVAGSSSGSEVANNCYTPPPPISFSGPWSGNFYANGTGNGVYDVTANSNGQSNSGQFTWQVSFSTEEFAVVLQPTEPVQLPVSIEYLSTTYGIEVSNLNAQGGQKEWSEHELSLLNDVFKELPKEILESMEIGKIARFNQDYDGSIPKPNVFGAFFPASGTIRIFDFASTSFDFENDPNGDTQFKATVLHEMIHAVQYRKDQYSSYNNPFKSPLVQTYMDAITPLTAIDKGIWKDGWVSYEWRGDYAWENIGGAENNPPTNYGNTNPTEDMSESVMMYVYAPQKLRDSSMLRYNFIKDQMFGGLEYENGIQKAP
ncbi:MAG: hypothetical protein NTZ74_00570 [Chloroflexi bacterium]|nr:hypothetical protein [Chloroflexota bacterium]